MAIHLPIRRKFFFSHFLAVLLVSGSVGTYFYLSAADSLITNLKSRLRNSAALVSQALDARALDDVRQKEDVTKPGYLDTLSLLRRFRKTNPDIAFLYVMRLQGDRVFFVVDSDESSKQALPGREYTAVPPQLKNGFFNSSSDERIQKDEWGSFMSGYAPVKNGEGEYLIGMDMRADEVQNKLAQIRLSGLISLIFSILLALVFSRFLSGHFTSPIEMLITRCHDIAEGRLGEKVEAKTGDELETLTTAFNSMSARLEESHQRSQIAEEALKRSRDELEKRVEERTRDLSEANEKLRREIAERKRVEEALAIAAKTDALTGLLNRRALREHLEYQIVRFERSRIPFSLLLCDIDHFKMVNDTCGHDVGDVVLQNVARILKECCRSQDLVARWGGEEFLVLLPDTDLEGGATVAEKMRGRMTGEVFPAGTQELPLTLSIGVTAFCPKYTMDDCIKAADQAMYEAKKRGRNRVATAEAEE